MPTFKFKAKKMDGEEIEGTREAENEFALAKSLKQEGYTIVDFELEGKKKKFSLASFSFGGVPLSEKMIFTRNLAVMIGAGLVVSRALEVLIRQSKNQKFKKALADISASITKGKSLSESMAEHSKIFPKLYISMVKAGEKSGKIDKSLKTIAEQMEKDYILRRKIKGALIYPCIVIIAMILIGILMLVYIVPILVSTFAELGVELPMSTKIIIWLSNSLIANSLLLLAGAGILAAFFFLALRKPFVRKLVDRLFLQMPLIAPLVRKINSARTARTLSSLIDSGVEILEAIDMTADVVQNVYYKNVLKNASEQIQKGATISSSFKKAEHVFPPLLGEMIAVGEETGKLSDMLLDLAVFYEGEVTAATRDMATVIEPVLIVVIGAAVGFFAVSMIKPMYSMMGGL
jgi:type IV pilus assembly protein PilC